MIDINTTNREGYSALKALISAKSIAIIGIGISNTPLVEFFIKAGAGKISVRDRKDRSLLPVCDELEALGAAVITGEKYLEELTEDILIKTPGLRPDVPEIAEAVKRGALLTSETELFVRFCPAKIFGVTGSDGKSTTTTLISKFLEEEGIDTYLGGNIGRPLLPIIDRITSRNAIALELSSFQLFTMNFSPDVSVITNLSENHLNWHKGMAEYLDAKKNILRFQNSECRAVLNLDDENTLACSDIAKGEALFFSLVNRPEKGVWLQDGIIRYTDGERSTDIIRADDIKLPGRHNIANYMAAIAATRGIVSNESVFKVARNFGGVEHRMEFVREFEGVKYYNSSIDSSPTRTLAALSCFIQKIIIICGGYDKKLDYSPLASGFSEHVKTAVLCGATAPKIKAIITSSPTCCDIDLLEADSFENAVNAARATAKKGDIVLLSPASASFDMFKNFEERGNVFKDLVRKFN